MNYDFCDAHMDLNREPTDCKSVELTLSSINILDSK